MICVCVFSLGHRGEDDKTGKKKKQFQMVIVTFLRFVLMGFYRSPFILLINSRLRGREIKYCNLYCVETFHVFKQYILHQSKSTWGRQKF